MKTFAIVFITILNFSKAIFLNSSKTYNLTCLEAVTNRVFLNEDVAVVRESFEQVYFPKAATYTNADQAKNFLIYLDDFNSVLVLFRNIHLKGRYILVVTDDQMVRNIFEMAQSCKLINLIVVVLSERPSTIFFRDDQDFCKTDFTINETQTCDTNITFFLKKRRNFWENCLIKVAYLITPPFVINITKNTNPGIMVSMFNLIEEKSGIMMDYSGDSNLFQVEFLKRGTLHQLTDALVSEEFDAAIGGLMRNDTITAPFEYGPILFNEKFRFTARKPEKLKSYKKLFVVFQKELWLKFVYAVLLMMVLFYGFSLWENFAKTALLGVVFNVFGIIIGAGVNIPPQTMSFRVLFVFFFMFSLSIDSIYLSKLSSIFSSSSYDISVKDVDLARARGIHITVGWQVEKILMLGFVIRNNPRVKKKYHIEDKSQSYFINHTALARDNNGSFLLDSVLQTYPSEASLLDFFHVPIDYLTLDVTFYLRKNGGFNDVIYFWALEMVEKGFTLKWFNDIKASNIRHEILPEEEDNLVILKLAHFEESFRVLFGGYALAFGALVLEFVYFKLEMVGIVQMVQDGVIFLLGLLKPPKLENRRIEDSK